MCKYANTKVIVVSTVEQINIIKKVLENKSETPKVFVPNTEFKKNLWDKKRK